MRQFRFIGFLSNSIRYFLGFSYLGVRGKAIGIPFGYFNGMSAPLIFEQVPDAPTTGTHEQANLSVARTEFIKANKHFFGVGTVEPFLLGHA
jgi:hypothetical protein